jgi:TPR repeat protein
VFDVSTKFSKYFFSSLLIFFISGCDAQKQQQLSPAESGLKLEWKWGESLTNWSGAYEYCEKLSQERGESWRLATALEIQRHFSVSSDNLSSDNYVWSALFNEKGVHYTVNIENGAKQWRGDDVVQAKIICVSGQTWDRDAWIIEANNAKIMGRVSHMIDVVNSEATKNNPSAQLEFGNLYLDGVGVPQDDTMALEWYKKAAANGSDEAQFKISEMRRVGRAPSDASNISAVQ